MAETFQTLCKGKGIRITELAKCCGISQSYLSRIVNGERKNVHPYILMQLARGLDISLSEIKALVATGEFENSKKESINNEGEQTEFQQCILEALDALDFGDISMFQVITQKVTEMNEQSIRLKQNYLAWYEGLNLSFANRYDESMAKFESAMRFKPKTETERKLLAKIIGGLGSVYVAKGNYQSAMKMLRKSLMVWGEGPQAGSVYLNMGTLLRRRHKYFSATQSYQRAVKLGASPVKLLAYTGLGLVALDLKDIVQARRYLLMGYMLAKSQENDEGKANLYCNLGQYYKEVGKLNRAIYALKRGLKCAERWRDSRVTLYILAELADAYLRIKDVKASEETLKTLESEINHGGDVLLVGMCFNTFAKKHAQSGCIDRALTLLGQNYRILAAIPPSEELLDCCRLLARYFLAKKKPYEADFYLAESKKINKLLQEICCRNSH